MKNRRTQIIVVIVLALLIGGYYSVRALTGGNNNALTASGTIETTDVLVGPEIGGKVAEVMVQEGDPVKAGAPLFKLDETLIQAQRNVAASALSTAKQSALTAQAALASAQAQYDIVQNAALSQVPLQQRTSDWTNATQSSFIVPSWYYSQNEQISAAQAAVDAAQQALTDQQANLSKVEASAASADFLKAENDMAQAQANYTIAKHLNDQVSNGKDITDLTRRGLFLLARDTIAKNKGVTPKWLGNNLDEELRIASQQIFDDANTQLDATKKAYLDVISSESEGATNVLEARGSVSVAQEHLYRAQDLLRSLQTGNDSPQLTAAQKALDQAKSVADQANSAVDQAQSNVDLIDAQLTKLTVMAPSDGVVLTRNVEPGEFVQPGASAITLGDLNHLTITVYVPEDRYGLISLGLNASVTVDSFPGTKFSAVVTNISDQAEFTPRNVQTVEGRSSTVYAIKLKVIDPEGKLKPGMPADVVFNTK
jgi:HlyD family secretion protein